MRKEIIWSPLAEEDLENILEYLAENWNQKVIIRFLNKIDLVTNQIAKVPNQYPIINKKLQVRKCVVTKQNTLFYREIEKQIEILRLYDTRQDPKKLKFL
jgi:plasmid stabilization system protein ParE